MRLEPALSVPLSAIVDCLTAVEAGDPLIIPVEFTERDRRAGWLAIVGDAVVGVGWSVGLGDAQRVEVRVRPEARRRGVGGALFRAVAGGSAPLVAGCDAGQHAVRRFLDGRGFIADGVIFVQRWDGEPGDVPPAFRTVTVESPSDRGQAAAVLLEAMAGCWPPAGLGLGGLVDDRTRLRVACAGDQPVGASAARLEEGAWAVAGLGVRPGWRGRGVGRMLLCELMHAASARGYGVVLRVSHDDERLLRWTRALGFWTCRSWISYRRPAVARQGPVVGGGGALRGSGGP